MRKLLLVFFALLIPVSIFGQVTHNPPLSCQVGGQTVSTQGLASTTTVQRSFPSCTVTVYLTGTSTLATIYSTSTLTPLANPFTAGTDGSINFWAGNVCYDIVTSGGAAGNTFPTPVTYTSVCFGSGGGGGGSTLPGGSPGQLQVNVGNLSFGGSGFTWTQSTLAAGINANQFIYTGGFGDSLIMSGGSANLYTHAPGVANNIGLQLEEGASPFTSCRNIAANTSHLIILGDQTNFPSITPTLCGDDNGWYSPQPPAGDSSLLIATTNFLTAPGPIGSVTPNAGEFTSLKATTLTGTAGTVVCTDGGGTLTLTGCSGGGGGSGTVNAGASGALGYYAASGTAISGDSSTTDDGSGNIGIKSLNITTPGTGIITFTMGTGTAAPTSGKASIWVDTITGNLSCLTASSTNCLSISGTPVGATGSYQYNGGSGALAASGFINNGSNSTTGPSQTFQSDILEGGTGCPNDTVTGTTQNKLATVTAGKCIKLTTGQTGVVPTMLIVGGTAGTSGNSYPLVPGGFGSCVFDGATTAGHLFGVSTTTAGDCTDLGTATWSSVTSGLWVGGIVQTSNGGAGTYTIVLSGGQIAGSGAGGGNMSTTTTNTMGAAGIIDMRSQTGANSLYVPKQPGITASGTASFGYDSTANTFVGGIGGVQKVFCTTNGESGCASAVNGPPGQTGNSTSWTTRVTSNFTTTSSSQTAITGLAITFPASTAWNTKYSCTIFGAESTGATSLTWSYNDVTTAPTNASALGRMITGSTTMANGVQTNTLTTGSKTILSATPNGTSSFGMQIDGAVEQPSGSASVFQIEVGVGGGANTLTIYKDSACTFTQTAN